MRDFFKIIIIVIGFVAIAAILAILLFSKGFQGSKDIKSEKFSNQLDNNFIGDVEIFVRGVYSNGYEYNDTIRGLILGYNNQIVEYINQSFEGFVYYAVFLDNNRNIDSVWMINNNIYYYEYYTADNISLFDGTLYLYDFLGILDENRNYTIDYNKLEIGKEIVNGFPSTCYSYSDSNKNLTIYLKYCLLTLNGVQTPILTYYKGKIETKYGGFYLEFNINNIRKIENEGEIPEVLVIKVININDTDSRVLSINLGNDKIYMYRLDPKSSIGETFYYVFPRNKLNNIKVNVTIDSPPGYKWKIQIGYINKYLNKSPYICEIDGKTACIVK